MASVLKTGLIFLVLFIACRGEGSCANTSGGGLIVRFSGNYSKERPDRPQTHAAHVDAMHINQPEENLAKSPNTFEAAKDLVIDRIIFRQWNLPARANDRSLASEGDMCIYARTQGIDPGPSELFCFSSYTVRPEAGLSEDGTPNGLTREIAFPRGAGIYFPQHTSFSCPSGLHRATRGLFSDEQVAAARWSCTIEFHVAKPDETVGRIARIPYVDTMVKPAYTGGNLINNSVAWYKGWEGPQPLVVRGFLVYAGVLGLNPMQDTQRHYENVCLQKLSKEGVAVQRECANSISYSSDQNVPSGSALPGVIELRNPIVLGANEQLTASCQTPDRIGSDCTLFVIYEAPPRKRIPSIADYYWDLGHVNTNLFKQGGFYCSEENMRQFNPAGINVLRITASLHSGGWANDSCRDDDLVCGCQNLFKPFPR